MMFLRFIHAVTGIRTSFLFKCSLSFEMGFAKPTEGFPGGSDGKASAYNAGDLSSIPGSGRSLEKEMATHSSALAWKIPWTEEPGRLQSTGSQRVGHD